MVVTPHSGASRLCASCELQSLSEGGLGAAQVLNERHVAQNMGIPVGAVITPVPYLERPPPRVPRRPICCTHCGAAANLYCKVRSYSYPNPLPAAKLYCKVLAILYCNVLSDPKKLLFPSKGMCVLCPKRCV